MNIVSSSSSFLVFLYALSITEFNSVCDNGGSFFKFHSTINNLASLKSLPFLLYSFAKSKADSFLKPFFTPFLIEFIFSVLLGFPGEYTTSENFISLIASLPFSLCNSSISLYSFGIFIFFRL